MSDKLSNSDIANALGLSHSTVSRMRAGERVASVEVLHRIAQEYDIEPGLLLRAAAEAATGDTTLWVDTLSRAWDGDPEAA